jgi:hypothetical protein
MRQAEAESVPAGPGPLYRQPVSLAGAHDDGRRPRCRCLGSGRVILMSTYHPDDFAELIEASPAEGFLSKSALSASAIRELLQSARE